MIAGSKVLYRTTDGGNSWSTIFNDECWDIKLKTDDFNTIFVSKSNSTKNIIEIFKCLDEYLVTYHKLLWCTKAPVKKFLDSYFKKRNDICEITTNELQNIIPNRKRAEVRLDNMNAVVAELDVMSEFIKSSVDKNDQLLFKLFLIFLNILSVGGQYYWSNYSKMNLCINVNK